MGDAAAASVAAATAVAFAASAAAVGNAARDQESVFPCGRDPFPIRLSLRPGPSCQAAFPCDQNPLSISLLPWAGFLRHSVFPVAAILCSVAFLPTGTLNIVTFSKTAFLELWPPSLMHLYNNCNNQKILLAF